MTVTADVRPRLRLVGAIGLPYTHPQLHRVDQNMTHQPVRAAIVGIGGIGGLHLAEMMQLHQQGHLQLVAMADNQMERTVDARRAGEEVGALHYCDYRAMYDAFHDTLDLVVIATPHHWHCRMTLDAFDCGFHVLLEKPPAVTIQDLDRLIARRQETRKLCAVNFHTLPSAGVQTLKTMVERGQLGSLRHVTVRTVWLRPNSYYARAPWAGRLRLDGQWVLDGPILNPLAHGINNALYLACAATDSFAVPVRVRGELYRGHAIESEDTSCACIETDIGVLVYYYGTLCGRRSHSPILHVEGNTATATLEMNGNLVVHLPDGERERVDMVDPLGMTGRHSVLMPLLAAIRDDTPLMRVSTLENARPYQLAANGIFESSGGITTIGPPYAQSVELREGPTVVVDGIEETFTRAAAEKALLSDLDLPWGRKTQPVDLHHYRAFCGDAYLPSSP